MNYRHRYHAGNFADVHKHVGLLTLLAAMQLKPKGFLYIDTHAGAGAYALGGARKATSAEADEGIHALLETADPATPALRHYRQSVLAWRQEAQQPLGYPGSPLLAARTLRPQDRAALFEQQPSECRALQRALGARRGVRIECADGYGSLSACLPPPERRSLALIDPPYEAAGEIQAALTAVDAGLQRLANLVLALWYPLKDERWLSLWREQLQRRLRVPAMALELWLYPRDSSVSLNGSGLLVINPPYAFQQHVDSWQRELWQILDRAGRGGQSVQTFGDVATSAASHV